LVAAPLLLISSIVMFCIPYVNLGFRMVWMAISYNLFAAIANPCYGTSHFLMVSLSTRDLNQRGQLSVVANIPAVAANGFVASILFPILLGWINAAPNNLEIQNRWQIIMIIFAVIAFIGCMLEYKFTRERITEEDMILSLERAEETQKDNILKVSVMEQLKSCMKDKYWWIIMIFYAFYQSGIMFKGGYIMNIFSHQYFSEGVVLFGFQLGADMVQSVLALLSGIPLALGMFFIWPLANKFGKKNMVVIGCVISIIGSVICLTNPDNFMIMLVGQTFKGFSSIPGAYIMMALFADVLDHLEARLGYRVDGISMSVYNTILTVVNGLAIAVFNFFYDNAAFVQAGVSKFFFLEFEIFAHGILLVILLFFNIENNIKEEQALIAERKGIS
ncbi:MAG TPA: MFS transporter, partial [Candidatus Merdenecus merdavium]|nr:MFS transporter [Candidatus Merdenecus merdavium]